MSVWMNPNFLVPSYTTVGQGPGYARSEVASASAAAPPALPSSALAAAIRAQNPSFTDGRVSAVFVEKQGESTLHSLTVDGKPLGHMRKGSYVEERLFRNVVQMSAKEKNGQFTVTLVTRPHIPEGFVDLDAVFRGPEDTTQLNIRERIGNDFYLTDAGKFSYICTGGIYATERRIVAKTEVGPRTDYEGWTITQRNNGTKAKIVLGPGSDTSNVAFVLRSFSEK